MDYKIIHGKIKELDSGSFTKGVGFIGQASDNSWGVFENDRGGREPSMSTDFEVRSQVHCESATPSLQASVL